MMEKGEVFQSGLADLLGHPKASTPHAVLLRQLFDSRLPKTEREHAAVREIERLTAKNERMTDAALHAQNAAIDLAQRNKQLTADNERLKAERDEAQQIAIKLAAENTRLVELLPAARASCIDLLHHIDAALEEPPL